MMIREKFNAYNTVTPDEIRADIDHRVACEETITDERKPGTAAQATKCPARQ